MKMLCLGPAGTYGHEAAMIAISRLKEDDLEIEFCKRNVEIIRRANDEDCYGVVPIENSTAGLVADIVKDFWLEQKLDPGVSVIGEIQIPVSHNLLVNSSTRSIGEIRKVISHPQALAQCRGNLEKLGLKNLEAVDSTASAANIASTPITAYGIAAVASKFAAQVYDLHTLKEGIEDSKGNATRFHVLGGLENLNPSGHDRTAILFWIPNEPGSLLRTLTAMGWINMSSIHSIPLGTPDTYAFYCEFDVHKNSQIGEKVIANLEKQVDRMLILGSYPREK